MLMYYRTYPYGPVNECRRNLFTEFGRIIDIYKVQSLRQHIHRAMLKIGI